jgi:hypothetical protein
MGGVLKLIARRQCFGEAAWLNNSASEGDMQTLMIPFTPRYFVLTACALLTVILFVIGLESLKALEIVIIPLLLFGALTLVGIRDMLQKRHAVLRN